MKIIQKIDKNTLIFYDKGSFDNWCVFIQDINGKRAPLDKDYFNFFSDLTYKYSSKRIYEEFVSIYTKVTDELKQDVLDFIIDLAKKYPAPLDREVAINFIVIYAGMIAERNKDGAILKERIKRLGMHQVLIEKMPVHEAANWSKGKNWRELDVVCKSKGF